MGLDVDLRHIAVAMRCGGGAISLGRKYSRQQLLGWIKQKVAGGATVYTVYECCGLGYTLHEQLLEAGAHSLITTPMRLNLERRRKNDRMDGRELCAPLNRYLEGQKGGTQSDSNTQPERTTAPGVGSTTGVLEAGVAYRDIRKRHYT